MGPAARFRGNARQGDERRQRGTRLIVTRLIGPRRHRASSFALPPLENAADVAPPIAAIIAAAAAEGAISTAEACEMSQVVERYSRALAGEEVEARLQRLEGACGLAE